MAYETRTLHLDASPFTPEEQAVNEMWAEYRKLGYKEGYAGRPPAKFAKVTDMYQRAREDGYGLGYIEGAGARITEHGIS